MSNPYEPLECSRLSALGSVQWQWDRMFSVWPSEALDDRKDGCSHCDVN